jgi:hypothetical protein
MVSRWWPRLLGLHDCHPGPVSYRDDFTENLMMPLSVDSAVVTARLGDDVKLVSAGLCE